MWLVQTDTRMSVKWYVSVLWVLFAQHSPLKRPQRVCVYIYLYIRKSKEWFSSVSVQLKIKEFHEMVNNEFSFTFQRWEPHFLAMELFANRALLQITLPVIHWRSWKWQSNLSHFILSGKRRSCILSGNRIGHKSWNVYCLLFEIASENSVIPNANLAIASYTWIVAYFLPSCQNW